MQAAFPVSVPGAAPQPDWIQTELFPFQREGVAWLKDRDKAMLCDEMGLGKTLQAIAWASAPGKGRLPCLVICPASIKLNWEREIDRALDLGTPKQSKLFQAGGIKVVDAAITWPSHVPDWTIINYDILGNFQAHIKASGFKSILLDEAHSVKNLDAIRTELVLDIAKVIPNRLYISGTPMLNRPIELFTALVFVGIMPQSSYRQFLNFYTESTTIKGRKVFTGSKNSAQLHEHLAGVMLRREKADVLKDLPPKLQTTKLVAISNAAEYQKASQHFMTWLRGARGNTAAKNASKAEVIVQLNHLRQLAAQGKVAPVSDMLEPCGKTGGKSIVFSSFVAPLNSLAALNKSRSILYTSNLNPAARQATVDAFQSGPKCYFMGTIAVAGTGITLTAANQVWFMDLPWSPGLKTQAEDRAHRIGQAEPVTIVNVLAKGTVDEKMAQVLAAKAKSIQQVIGGKAEEEAGQGVEQALIDALTGMAQLGQEDPGPVQYVPEMVEMDQEGEIAVDAETLKTIRVEQRLVLPPETQRRLERLKYRATLYELVMERAGEKYLVLYSGQSRDNLLSAVRKHGTIFAKITGSSIITFGKRASDAATSGDWRIYFSGRTEREAITEGELPFIKEVVREPPVPSGPTQSRLLQVMGASPLQAAMAGDSQSHLVNLAITDGPKWWARLHADMESISCEPCRDKGVKLMNGVHDTVSAHLGKDMQKPDDFAYLKQMVEEAGVKMGQHPVCTSAQGKKLERCIHHVKDSGSSVNPWAACITSVGCKPDKVKAHSPLLELLVNGATQAAGMTIGAHVVSKALGGVTAVTSPQDQIRVVEEKKPRVYNPNVVEGDQATVDLGTLLEEIDAILRSPDKMGLVDPANLKILKEGA